MDASAPESRPESTPPQQPDFASIWDGPGLLYLAMTILGAMLGGLLVLVLTDVNKVNAFPTSSQIILLSIQIAGIAGLSLGVAQWIPVRWFALRAFRQVTGKRNLSQPERRFVRDTAWWIIATIAGTVVGTAFIGFVASHGGVGGLESFILFFVQGALLGSAQWVLIRRCIKPAGVWIIWTAVALSLIPIEALIIGGLALYSTMVAFALLIPTGAFVLGTFQALCLKQLARKWLEKIHQRAHQAPVDGA